MSRWPVGPDRQDELQRKMSYLRLCLDIQLAYCFGLSETNIVVVFPENWALNFKKCFPPVLVPLSHAECCSMPLWNRKWCVWQMFPTCFCESNILCHGQNWLSKERGCEHGTSYLKPPTSWNDTSVIIKKKSCLTSDSLFLVLRPENSCIQ